MVDEALLALNKLLKKQGVKNFNIMLYDFPTTTDWSKFTIALIGVEDISGKALLFTCNITVYCPPCGVKYIVITAHDVIRDNKPTSKIFIPRRIGVDYDDIPNLRTSYFNRLVSTEVILADIMFKYCTVVQTIHNINPN